jgi:hypothetical protein
MFYIDLQPVSPPGFNADAKSNASKYDRKAHRQQGKSGRCFNKSTAKSRFRKASKTASQQEGKDGLNCHTELFFTASFSMFLLHFYYGNQIDLAFDAQSGGVC